MCHFSSMSTRHCFVGIDMPAGSGVCTRSDSSSVAHMARVLITTLTQQQQRSILYSTNNVTSYLTNFHRKQTSAWAGNTRACEARLTNDFVAVITLRSTYVQKSLYNSNNIFICSVMSYGKNNVSITRSTEKNNYNVQ